MNPQQTEPTRLKFMHGMHRTKPDEVCAHCRHFAYYHILTHRPRRICALYTEKTLSHAAWARNWPACGKFEQQP